MSPNKITSYQYHLFRCLTIGIALVLPLQDRSSAQFISNNRPTEIYKLATPQILAIPPVKQSEISPSSSSDFSTSPGNLLTAPHFNLRITRELPGLWQIRVPANQVGSLFATYELRAINGRNNTISSNKNASAVVGVILEPLPITEISRDPNSKTALLQGGVRLRMDLSNTQFAGEYSGNLLVILNRR
jgi:hypothetical protein